MRRWLQEPLLHFLLAGGLLFVAYGFVSGDGDDGSPVVRITAAEVEWLEDTWARQWQRPPTDDELRGLVASHLKETLLAREARAHGLDRNDTVVRRRLAQKMAFLVEDVADLAEPQEGELRRLYDREHTRYRPPANVTFTQIYFKTEAAAQRGLQAVTTDAPVDIGEPSLLERDHERADEHTVASLFGPEFARTLFGLEPGAWHGPVASAYGYHVVRVHTREEPGLRPFEEVRAQVLAAWRRDAQAEASERFLAELLRKYDVVVDESVRSRIGPLAKVAQ